MYIISYFYTQPDDFMVNKPQKIIDDHEVWRIFLCPLITRSLFGDIMFSLPIYLIFFAYMNEWKYGTARAFLTFFFMNLVIQLVIIALYIPISMVIEDMPETVEWAFFSVLMCEVYRTTMAQKSIQMK